MTGTVHLASGGTLDFSGPPLVMAIVNCNGDSFYGPSRSTGGDAVEKALKAAEDGAGIIDFGAESTRPGASYVTAEEEIERLVPVIEAFRKQSSVAVSVDTRKAQVARAVLDAGADIINDISSLEDDPDMAPLCAERGAMVVLMHKKGIPETMQDEPYYEDVVSDVRTYLIEAIDRAKNNGIPEQRIILDPGFGFGKRLEDNLDILAHLAEICGTVYPVLVGLSRKSFIGEITGRPAEDRLAGTLAANTAALFQGAGILRVHDVPDTVDLVKIYYAQSQRQGR
ncbi:dihydropteroate synthase [Breznakiella homolactica]|uniref:dihydropteroate synthase n=1 Tax=Breznakiella homolactica TaxID=2798577 RepID=A0A7T7XJS9_9SPIR|nr:dihydropteroate synthase [Breznakiella homolactica]QQO07468.1 dihydropteroate synthase [Breznakiella homolactica]